MKLVWIVLISVLLSGCATDSNNIDLRTTMNRDIQVRQETLLTPRI
jgi:hypothetical protein